MILPLTGKQYSEKVVENCAAYWKAIGAYSDAEAKALDKFLEVFQTESFPPGASILFTQAPLGSLTVCCSNSIYTSVVAPFCFKIFLLLFALFPTC